MLHKVNEAVSFIRKKIASVPEIAIVLGSGLGDFADEIKESIRIPYKNIPYFPVGTVPGHSSELAAGKINDRDVLCMKGRMHYYEVGSMEEVVFPMRVLQLLGTKIVLFTNASGAINPHFHPGDFIVIRDHINFIGTNPLMGKHEDAFGPYFVDLTDAYDSDLRKLLKNVFTDLDMPYKEGVYVATTGPSYETPAEIRMFKTLGADIVGMSTIPSVIVAKQGGLKVAALSCVTNYAAGISTTKISHEEVIERGKQVQDKFEKVLIEFINLLE